MISLPKQRPLTLNEIMTIDKYSEIVTDAEKYAKENFKKCQKSRFYHIKETINKVLS